MTSVKKPSLLTPKQARGLKELALAIWKQQGLRLYGSAYRDAIDELTATPPSQEWCIRYHMLRGKPYFETCSDYGPLLDDYNILLRRYGDNAQASCRHPDFDGKNCPMGRWEGK